MSVGISESRLSGCMPMIIGNHDLRLRFCDDVMGGRLSHAYIIEGAKGMGKYTLALNLAAAVSCECHDSDKALPCGKCNSCRKILEGLTPDVTVITTLQGKSSISKEQIKEMRAGVCFSPNEMKRRVIIIREAEKMTSEAQNALLLTLEEPPEYILFLLLTENAGSLLETVRSRAPSIRMRAVDDETIEKYLIDHVEGAEALLKEDPEAFSEIIVSAGGSIGAAADLFSPEMREDLLNVRRVCDQFIECFPLGGLSDALEVFEDAMFKTREDTGRILGETIKALRDLLLLRKADNVHLCYYTSIEKAEKVAERFSAARLVKYITLCDEARTLITDANTNVKLTLLNLASDMLRSK